MTMASGRLVYATTTGTLSAVDFANGLPPPAPPPFSAARPSTASLAVQGVVRPLTANRSGPHPGGCGPDPFRYPAPRRPL
jgi:hypothetical protein